MPTGKSTWSAPSFAVVTAARLFALLAIGAPALWFRDEGALVALLVLAILWLYQVVTMTRRELELTLTPAWEAAAVGVICALAMEPSPAILAALAVPPLYATATAGLRTMVRTVACQLVAVVSIGLMWYQRGPDSHWTEWGVSIFTWSMAGVGLSLVASTTFYNDLVARDRLAPYRDAQHLLKQLIDLSGDLSSGLDVAAIGGEMLGVVGDLVPTRALALYVPRGDVLTPIASSSELDPADNDACEKLATDAWARAEPVTAGQGFAFAAGDAAVIAGLRPGTEKTPPDPPFEDLASALAPSTVKFDTALLFTHFRDVATADERQRLAREMHDGVAQDIASLGYLVDALAARPADEQQAKQFAMLRERVTKVVAEVRRSVMNLRTSIGENESLGAAISAVARHLSEASGIPIRVRLDEQPARLRPEVEAELFRIAQEAMNNAVKHARATAIDVRCQVYAPDARIIVADDGVGLQGGRSDSHGLKIMRERAKLIGAQLTVRDNASRGLTVSVTLRAPGGPVHPPERTLTKETR
ncbi:sensor histidine kinase [Nocardioides humilatus]|uniref:Sensor histidine kinase n=1 Tax=Nocardioides humilatus TaxID=2607660 RepID=A0A5B1LB54_9ACTN|nr:sensor histidine kinase [Nocardioides humilatus]KAA1417971.1 sensor histidine kinase [Nocardioides humilatus]